jgi:hypothetical protein
MPFDYRQLYRTAAAQIVPIRKSMEERIDEKKG